MPEATLESVLTHTNSVAHRFRNNDLTWQPYVFAKEYTNWIMEQRAVYESCAVVDQSFHMEILRLTGAEAVDLLEYLGVNSFEKIRTEPPPRAINYLTCNPDGYVIGDVIVFYTDDEEFTSVGSEWINNWIRYHAESGAWDVQAEVLYHPFDDHDPPDFRFQIQGPRATDVLDNVIDGGFPDISFWEMKTVEIGGVETFALGHGMAASQGLEIFGPFEHHDRILKKIMDSGDRFGIRQMGTKAYKTGKIGSGWFVAAVPAIYEHPELQGYREWLESDSMEANLSIGGSYESDDISDYYMTPMERGQANLIDWNHDFIGKEGLEAMRDDTHRDPVTLIWDSKDVIRVYESYFQSGAPFKFIDLPDVATRWSVCHYDKVRFGDDMVGISKYPGYLIDKREMLSLATVDPAYSAPGTKLVFDWGDTSDKRRVESHEMTEIGVTVAPTPYIRNGRRSL